MCETLATAFHLTATRFGSNNARAPDMEFFLAALQVKVAPRRAKETTTRETRRGARWLYRNVVWILFLALACLLFFSPLLLIGFLLVPTIFFTRWFALGSPFPHTRVNFIVLIFLLAVLWGMLRAADVQSAVMPAAHLLGGVALLYVIADYADHPGRLWNVAGALAVSGIAIAFAAPFITEPSPDKLVNVTFLFEMSRFYFDWSNPNMVAGVLAALLPLALALLLNGAKGQGESDGQVGSTANTPKTVAALRKVGALALAPMVVMLLLLQARSAWFAAVSGVLIYLGLFRRWLIVLAPVTLLLLFLLNAYSDELRALLPFRVSRLQFTPSLQGRREVWDFAAAQIVREPLGHGIGSFKAFAENAGGDRLTEPQRQHAHNLFLQAGFEVGFIGLGAFAALFAYALYASWHAIARDVKKHLAIGVFAALCAALLSDLLEANMWGNKAALWLWALFGMAVVLGRYGARRRHTQRGKSLG